MMVTRGMLVINIYIQVLSLIIKDNCLEIQKYLSNDGNTLYASIKLLQESLANNGDPDEMPYTGTTAFHQGLH